MEVLQDPFEYNLVLIGFMGTGKSTVAKCLGKTCSMDIADMDQIIEKREGMTISKLFDKYGEEYFRDLETQLLIELQTRKHMIISCGGGAVLKERNIKEMKKNGRVVLLEASPETVLQRVKNNRSRPLLQGHKDIDSIKKLMEERREKYRLASDIVVETDHKTVMQICREIVTVLLEMGGKYV